MIILNNMYTGRYISQQGKLGHEAINLIRADDGKFYIWLNSMGVCAHSKVDNSTILLVRTINSTLYKVLAKAENCHLCDGANIPRMKYNAGVEDKERRAEAQRKLGVTYNGRDPMDDIYHENDMFATFWTDNVRETRGDVYLTNDQSMEDPEQHIYYADFCISEAMRAYITPTHKAHTSLSEFLQKDIWKAVTNDENRFSAEVQTARFNFFKLIRKDKDELAFSNALAYFIQKCGIDVFLSQCLNLTDSFLTDEYVLLREKNNIDISFFGENHVVIIENKIDAYITADRRKTKNNQIKKSVDLYFPDQNSAGQSNIESILTSFTNRYYGEASQLSKYYLYAVAYLLSKGMDITQVEEHIHCFLLVPEYAKKQFKQNNEGYFVSDFLLSDKYKLLTYKDISEFFGNHPVEDVYFEDFHSAMDPLKKEVNNELEEEMKIRFLQAIGKA